MRKFWWWLMLFAIGLPSQIAAQSQREALDKINQKEAELRQQSDVIRDLDALELASRKYYEWVEVKRSQYLPHHAGLGIGLFGYATSSSLLFYEYYLSPYLSARGLIHQAVFSRSRSGDNTHLNFGGMLRLRQPLHHEKYTLSTGGGFSYTAADTKTSELDTPFSLVWDVQLDYALTDQVSVAGSILDITALSAEKPGDVQIGSKSITLMGVYHF